MTSEHRTRRPTIVVAAVFIGLCGPLAPVPAVEGVGTPEAAPAAEERSTAGAKKDGAEKKPEDKKQEDKKQEEKKQADKKKPPACMHCGATCGLEAVCVCTCGTKKNPRIEYETTDDPVCVPCCGGLSWPFGCRRHGPSCTDCTPECRAWVRQRKKLVKETKDEEVPVIERTVAYVCGACAGCEPAGCCGGSPPRRGGWLPAWVPWPVH